MDLFSSLHPVLQGLIATLFTYAVTALGASFVFFFKRINKTVLDVMLGFAAGVMTAASYWSLLSPSIETSESLGYVPWIMPCVGFAAGGAFVMLSDVLTDRAEKFDKNDSRAKRAFMLASAVTVHNIPEGLAVGVAFGSLASGQTSLAGAVMLAVGIGLQNFPEGLCVSVPLYLSGKSRAKSFFIGQASGLVEPVAGVLGTLFAVTVRSLLPFALSFSGGAMIAVVCSEIVPEAFEGGKKAALTGVISGFTVMMLLDVALG
ncbi:MAG: ZIP family metal transporter [Clostridia bacterium]|nr:ZIP family metal transporter [Clostridia bacterium]